MSFVFIHVDSLSGLIKKDQAELKFEIFCQKIKNTFAIEQDVQNIKEELTSILNCLNGLTVEEKKEIKKEVKKSPKIDSDDICSHKIVRGDKKGERCPNKSVSGGKCRKHAQSKSDVNDSNKQPILSFKKLEQKESSEKESSEEHSEINSEIASEIETKTNSETPLEVTQKIPSTPKPVKLLTETEMLQKDSIYSQFDFINEECRPYSSETDFWKHLRKQVINDLECRWHRQTRLVLFYDKEKVYLKGTLHNAKFTDVKNLDQPILDWCRNSKIVVK